MFAPARVRRAVTLLVSGLALLAVLPSAASAQATRTWVSGVGDDANPCSRTAPCKTFAGSISKTAAGGEINVIDPGGFGAVTITKSIKIRAVGNSAGVLTSAGNGINVAAGANDRVTLQGLDLDGLGTATNGVRFTSGRFLRILDTNIDGFSTAGVQFSSTTPGARLLLSRTDISGIGTSTGVGVQPGASGSRVTISHSSIADNINGVAAVGTPSSPATINVFNSTLTDNTNGIFAASSDTLFRLSHDLITGNQVGVLAAGSGQIISNGTNDISGNDTDGAPTSTVLPK